MSLLSVLAPLVSPITNLIDKLHTSDEEKLQIEKAMLDVQANLTMKMIEYESQLLEAQRSVIVAEAQGQSWMQRNWRPITMLTFLTLVVLDSFDLLAWRLSEHAWELLQIGIGGYVLGRSAEKVVPVIAGAMKK